MPLSAVATTPSLPALIAQAAVFLGVVAGTGYATYRKTASKVSAARTSIETKVAPISNGFARDMQRSIEALHILLSSHITTSDLQEEARREALRALDARMTALTDRMDRRSPLSSRSDFHSRFDD